VFASKRVADFFPALIDFATHNHKPSMREGIEGNDMLDQTRRLPLNYMQGFYIGTYSRPIVLKQGL